MLEKFQLVAKKNPLNIKQNPANFLFSTQYSQQQTIFSLQYFEFSFLSSRIFIWLMENLWFFLLCSEIAKKKLHYRQKIIFIRRLSSFFQLYRKKCYAIDDLTVMMAPYH
jgi:sensor histidine kinase YesM